MDIGGFFPEATRLPQAMRGKSLHRLGITVIILANLGLWLGNGIHEWAVRGLFAVMGVDWGRFWGAARAFEHVSPTAAYQLPAIAAFMQPLATYSHSGIEAVRVGPAPYPPIFLALFDLFTEPSPPLGFALWTVMNLALAVLALRSVAAECAPQNRWRVTLLLVSAFPLMMELYVGQVEVILLVCLMLALREFERGHATRGGIWIGLMVLKPQYVVCLLLVLVLKRRRAELIGSAIGAGAILVSSLVVGGIGGFVAYLRLLITDYPAYKGAIAINPHGMIDWRTVLLTLAPGAPHALGLTLLAILSLLTVALLPLIWHGRWEPGNARFDRQMTATLIVTLLVAYHSQPHGAALLLAPAGLMIARGSAPRPVSLLLVGMLAVAPPIGLASALLVGNLTLISLTMIVVLVAVLVLLVRAEIIPDRIGTLMPSRR
jgi:hypothetical protein